MRVVLVVPCYNEATRLPVEAFRAYDLAAHELVYLFVNDGSTDDTLSVLEGLHRREPERCRVLDVQPNGGKAEAVRRGVLEALGHRADAIGFWDADLATPLEELDRFCDVLEARADVDVVFGSRVKMLGRTIERRAYRHLYGRAFATAVSNVLGLPVYDSQCGAKLFRVTDDLPAVFAERFVTRWIFDVEILARYIGRFEPRGVDTSARIYELPLSTWRHVEGSKVGMKDAAIAAVDLGRIAARHHAELRARRRRGSQL